MSIKFEDLVKGNIEVYKKHLIYDNYSIDINSIKYFRYFYNDSVISLYSDCTEHIKDVVLNYEVIENNDIKPNELLKLFIDFIKRKEIEEI